MGASVEAAPECSFLDIPACPGPRIVFHSSFAVFPHEIAQRFNNGNAKDVVISPTSTLVLKGNVDVRSLRLDGSLSISTTTEDTSVSVRANGVAVANRGHIMEAIDAEDREKHPEVDRMRGYVLKRLDMTEV